MYDQIQQHNINRNKIMEQTKNHILTVMDKRMKKFEDKNMAYSTKIEKFELEMDEKMELVRNMLNQSRSKLKKNGANTPSRSPTRKTNNIITRREFAT